MPQTLTEVIDLSWPGESQRHAEVQQKKQEKYLQLAFLVEQMKQGKAVLLLSRRQNFRVVLGNNTRLGFVKEKQFLVSNYEAEYFEDALRNMGVKHVPYADGFLFWMVD